MTFGDPKMSSGSPPESPSGTRGRPVLPPRRKIANRLRGSTISGTQQDPWRPSAPQPPITLLQLCKDTVPLTGLPCLPARRTRGVGGVLGLGLGAGGWGWGLGAPWLDGPNAFVHRPEPRPPSIRKRCACGFPQGTTLPLRHASKNLLNIQSNFNQPRTSRSRRAN